MIYYGLDKYKNVIEISQDDSLSYFKDDKRRVADNTIECITHYRVSTVFLVSDHSHSIGGRPILFETMIFDSNGSDMYCQRYSTWDEAVEGHKKAIEIAKSGKF